jgi:hypothetical protein
VVNGVTTAVATGTHVDPASGKATLASFFSDWSERQVWADGVVLPRQRRAEHAMTIPSPRDVGKIMAAADEWFRP